VDELVDRRVVDLSKLILNMVVVSEVECRFKMSGEWRI
jgi:hypothetical protein